MASYKLKVSLDTSVGANPPVIISQRNANVKGKRIRWTRDKEGPEFKFWRLDDLDQVAFPGQSISKGRKRAFCNNKAPVGDAEYPYTIIVEYNSVFYDSTETGIPPNPKPVIRND